MRESVLCHLVIHYCTLRVVRRGGWSWGPDPQRLLNAAVHALPELIARKLADLWPDDSDREFAAPVRITVSVRMSDLLAATAEVPGAKVPTVVSLISALSGNIEQAIRTAFQVEHGLAINTVDAAKHERAAPYAEEEASTPELLWGGTLLRVLLSWRDQGVLERRLAAFSQSSLEAWHSHLFKATGKPPSGVAEASSEAIDDLVRTIAQGISHSISDRAVFLRHRLTLAIEVTAQLRMLPSHPAVQEALDRVLPLDRGAEVEVSTSADVAKHKHIAPHIEEEASAPELLWGGTLLRVLLSWRDQGVLEHRLAAFSQSSLEAWHSRLFKAIEQPPPGIAEAASEAIADLVRALAQSCSHSISDRAVFLRHRLMLAIEVTAQLRVLPNHPAVREALDRVLPLDRGAEVEVSTSAIAYEKQAELLEYKPPIEPDRATRAMAPWHMQQTGPSPPRPLRQAEVYVSSALPFLLLGPLSQIGYLETLTATLEAADLLPELPQFAAALAYKVLDPPERGWLRPPATVAAATVFAGLEEPVAEPDLVEFARKVSTHLSPLDAVLSETLIAGHSPDQPLLLQRADLARGSGLLLVDVEGLFPLAWSTELEGLFPTLTRLGAVLLIPQTTADPELLASLDAGGFRFITDAPPTRHESWQPLRQARANRWWTNDRTASSASLIQLAQHLPDATEETDALWQALAVERPCVPLAVDSALERSLTLAAAVALGTIAWELWRERELVVPHLALQRFRDLDARVSFDHHSVRVRLPLGQRYQDLYEHGLLVDVPDVPWLGERVLQFSGG